MKPIIAITFLITLMLMGAPAINDTLTHIGSGKGAAESSLSSGTQDAGSSTAKAAGPCVQSANMQQNTGETTRTLPGKNTANLIIIL